MQKKVQQILTNAHILTMDADLNQYPHGAIAIDADSIIAVGPADEIAADFRHARAVTDTRAVRVISAVKFTDENRAANHAAIRAAA